MDIFVGGFVKSIIDSLSFDDLVDLDKLVNMNDEEIKIKQDNLEKFYNEKLSPTSFLNIFESRRDNEIISCNDVESLKWLQ